MGHIIDFLVNEFGVKNGTAVSIVVTLFVFIAGIIVTELLKIFSRYLVRRNTRLVLKNTCDLIVNSSIRQSKVFIDISEKINFSKVSILEYDRVELQGIYLLKDIGYEKLFKASLLGFENFFKGSKKRRSKALSKVWGGAKAIKYIYERAYPEIEIFIDKYNLKNDKRNQSVNNLRKAIFDLQTTYEGKIVPLEVKEYFEKIDTIQSNWANKEERTRPDIVHNHLVIPLEKLDKKNRINHISVILNPLILDSKTDYENQKNFLKNMAEQFRFYSRIMHQNSRIIRLAYPILTSVGAFKKSIFS